MKLRRKSVGSGDISGGMPSSQWLKRVEMFVALPDSDSIYRCMRLFPAAGVDDEMQDSTTQESLLVPVLHV